MARGTGSATTEETATTSDGTKVIARNPALKPTPQSDIGPIDDQGRFTGHGAKGLTFERRWTTPGIHPYDEITWDLRSAEIKNESGGTVFEQTDIEVPSFWSQLATNVVVSKYFRGHIGTPGRETQRQAAHRPRRQHDRRLGRHAALLRHRRRPADLQGRADPPPRPPEDGLQLARSGSTWAWKRSRSARPASSTRCATRWAASWTSPRQRPCSSSTAAAPASTCSPIRGSKEQLSRGGIASGPVSFMKGFDAFAGVVKSGGKTRRAAKMVILDADHPDVVDFIDSKANEEKKAWALIEAGYDASFTGEAYGSVFFQNANHCVRVTDEFMRAVQEDRDWSTHEVTSGKPATDVQGPRPLPQDGRCRPHLRRPRHPVRHHHQRLAHVRGHGPHLRQQPVQRIHVPERHGLQPGQPQPDEVRQG